LRALKNSGPKTIQKMRNPQLNNLTMVNNETCSFSG
jgi:hypothetical protein